MSEDGRHYARIEVDLGARLRPLDDEACAALRTALCIAPSVWAPSGESRLRDLVNGSVGTDQATFAQALLDVSAEIVRLRSRLERSDAPPSYPARILELSGGGGRIQTELPLQINETLELSVDADEDALPPLRCLVSVVHRCDVPRMYGVRIDAIHPYDKDRLIRAIYMLQRQALRRAHADQGEPVEP